jgi:hypothetical protein
MKSMVEAADRGEGERWSGRFGLHHGGVGTAAVLKWYVPTMANDLTRCNRLLRSNAMCLMTLGWWHLPT